jgi:ATP-dependent helicase HrpB
MAARRVAEELGERVGETVGYQVRFEEAAGPRTRVRFVTEGILGRKLLASPDLRGLSVVILDEFHERHLQGDVALAFVEHLRRTRRPELRIVVMSATLATEPLATYLDAPVLRSQGRRFDVAIDHLPARDDRPLESQVASAVRRLVVEKVDGDLLVFLPGAAEIRRARDACSKIAGEADLALVPLHGDLSPVEQDEAVRPAGRRKIILSTNVAESSITIEGVVAVVDSGLARIASQAPWSGLPRVRVEKVSRASAVQRAGRAGRTQPGRCLRLYTRADFEARPEHETPEIHRLDLAQTRLEIAALGSAIGARRPPDPREPGTLDLPWFERPPEAHVRAAEGLLGRMGALDTAGAITETGRAMLRFAVHPRIARVLVEAERRGVSDDACIAAAILAEGDVRASSKARFAQGSAHDEPTDRSDVLALVDRFREAQESGFSADVARAAGLDPGATRAAARTASHLARACDRRRLEPKPDAESALCLALLAGYPDRVAKRVRAGGRQIALAAGGAAELAETSVVRDAEWLVALDAEERARGARAGIVVRLASAIDPEWLIDLFPRDVEERRDVGWNAETERVQARDAILWEGLVLHATEKAEPTTEEASRVLAEAALAAGPRVFAPEGAIDRWLARTRFAATIEASVPAPDDEAVRAVVVHLCQGRSSFAELRAAGLLGALRDSLGPIGREVDRIAPERVTLAAGRTVVVRYEAGRPPSIASRLQDFFGMSEGPRLGDRAPLVLELLAPNGRAVQVTADFGSAIIRRCDGS